MGQKEHSPTHAHPDHQTSFINLLHLPWSSIAPSLFNVHLAVLFHNLSLGPLYASALLVYPVLTASTLYWINTNTSTADPMTPHGQICITTVNNSCFLPYSTSFSNFSSSSRVVPWCTKSETIHLLACNFCQLSSDYKNSFTDSATNLQKMWLLKILPHLECVVWNCCLFSGSSSLF